MRLEPATYQDLRELLAFKVFLAHLVHKVLLEHLVHLVLKALEVRQWFR